MTTKQRSVQMTREHKSKRPLLHKQVAILRKIGERMREAREMCGMSQTVAAKRLGLSNSSRLAKIENAVDVRTAPEWLLLDAAGLYQVSLDYLYGASDDWETSARMTQEREIGGFLFATLEAVRRRDMEAFAGLHEHIEALRANIDLSFQEAARASEGLRRFVELNPGFETMRGSAMVAGSIERAAEAATQGVRLVAKFRQRCRLAAADTHQLSLQLA